MAPIQIKLSKKDTDEMLVIVDKLDAALCEHNQLPTVVVLSRLLPSVWCAMHRFETATDALDMWRALNAEMEEWIKQHFGRIHYADEEDRLQ